MGDMLLIRHGETEWNRLHKYQGTSDIPLNAEGIEQAQKAAIDVVEYLKEQGSNHGTNVSIANDVVLYASTLSRARMTAEIIGEVIGVDVRLDERLREIHFGLWEGLTFNEVYEQCREAFDQWYANPMEHAAHGGETLSEVLVRSKAALVEIRERHPEATIIVVAHGGVIKTLLHDIRPEYELWNQQVAPCSITNIGVFPGK